MNIPKSKGAAIAGIAAGLLLLGLVLLMAVNGLRRGETAQSFTKEELIGKFAPELRADFKQLPLEYTAGKPGLYLRDEAFEAFVRMREAAWNDGVRLTVISATRNFVWQKGIWEAKWNGTRESGGVNVSTIADPVERARAILRYSSMPGTSRHHWGTDIDLNSLDNVYFASGEGEKVYRWLTEHAYDFGFAQPYTAYSDGRTCGYQEEKWHWSYLPLSVLMLYAYTNEVTLSDIAGFAGSDTAAALDVINVYVLGINERCLHYEE